jgi:hypothetical protein
MANQARQQLQQKMSLGSMEEKTIVETIDSLGSPKSKNHNTSTKID